MFGKKTTASAAAEPTVIGRGAVIEGKVRASGPIQIDGHIDGALIVDGAVSIGPSGAITGEVVADDIVVGGQVEGKLLARAHLHVASGGSVRGEVRYGTLQIDRGGLIDGTTAQGEPAAAASAPELSGVSRVPAAVSGTAQAAAPQQTSAATTAAAPQARASRAAS